MEPISTRVVEPSCWSFQAKIMTHSYPRFQINTYVHHDVSANLTLWLSLITSTGDDLNNYLVQVVYHGEIYEVGRNY